MALMVGGTAAILLGIIGLFVWWHAFLTLIKGILIIALLLAGGFAVYIGNDELKEKIKEEKEAEKDELHGTRQELE